MKCIYMLKAIQDLVYPPCCAACSRILPTVHPSAFCPGCWNDIEWVESPLCRLCGRAFNKKAGEDSFCGQCLRVPPAYTMARSVVHYTQPVKKLIHQLKYGKNLSALQGIFELAGYIDRGRFSEVDYILPVPLHIDRLRRRGWNQSILLAQQFFPEKKKKIKVDWLIKKENSPEQTGLSGAKRRLNLKTAFALGRKAQLGSSIICLVDDVFTTGTTVDECSRVIRRAGAKEILVLTLTRADVPNGK